ncbi:MAG: LysR family transcriptional regulator [Pseudomonadota bacterium]
MQTGVLEHIRTFVRAVETGSFTAVANEQGQSQPTVSRQITALEDHLGVRLMQRTTRALALTEEGQVYYDHARALLDATEQAALSVKPGAALVSGRLRVAAPLAFARLHLMPLMPAFLAAHPDLTTDWVLGDRPVDLVEEAVDVAIRIGHVTDQSLIVRRIGETRRMAVATPNFLERQGVPEHPDDLTRFDCIVYTGLATRDEWHFLCPEHGTIGVRVSGRVQVSASEGMRTAVLLGLGIAVCPTWLFIDEIERGLLVPILTDYEPKPLPTQAVMPSRRMVTPRVRAFVDHVAEEFRLNPRLSNAMETGQQEKLA